MKFEFTCDILTVKKIFLAVVHLTVFTVHTNSSTVQKSIKFSMLLARPDKSNRMFKLTANWTLIVNSTYMQMNLN